MLNNASLPHGSIQGYTDFGFSGCGGPCPPAGDPAHRYIFTLYALPIASVGLTSGATGGLLGFVTLGSDGQDVVHGKVRTLTV